MVKNKNSPGKLKVALVHDYLLQYGGAEKTLEAILELFPEAPIFTGLYSPKVFPKAIRERKIHAIKNPLIRTFSKIFTFIMPLVFEGFDLDDYDIIISDSSCWAKGVITKPDQLHISYIHTPPRFLYKYSVESPKRYKWYYKPIVAVLDHFLRIWDYAAAQRPDFLLTNSQTTRARIEKFYRRNATIIHPPTETAKRSNMNTKDTQKDYYCSLGRLAAYKNTDLLVRAFNKLGWELLVMGTGPEEEALRKLAKENVKILGRVSEEKKAEVLSNAKGLIFPVVEEDWGIVPLEAMAYGKPVLAHKSGGATETVKEGVTGAFFDSLDINKLIEAIKSFDEAIQKGIFADSEEIKNHTARFSKERFQRKFKAFVEEKWAKHREEHA